MSDLPPLPPPPQASSAAPETLAEIVELARRQNYSDIHLGVGEQPRFRERGEIISSDWPTTEAVQFDRWLSEVLSSAERSSSATSTTSMAPLLLSGCGCAST